MRTPRKPEDQDRLLHEIERERINKAVVQKLGEDLLRTNSARQNLESISTLPHERVNEVFQQVARISTTKGKLPETGAASVKKMMGEVAHAYQKNDLVLVLGAGVSLDAGLPTWTNLLQRLFMKTIEEEGPLASDFFAAVFSNIFNPNPMMLGRYLQKFHEDKSINFSEVMHKSLYENFEAGTLDDANATLKEIVHYCIAPGKSPNLNSIITYNFDDVLEQLLRRSGVEVPFKSISKLGDNADFHELPIYHVHGYLPFDLRGEAGTEITFGEMVYHKQYTDIYSWNNIVQINKFRDNTCLFIGSSLTDPNTRRLLDIAKAQKGKTAKQHYILKRRYPMAEVTERLETTLAVRPDFADRKVLASLNLEESSAFLHKIYQAYEEADAQSLGVRTIWFDAFEEIPGMLRGIREFKVV